MYIYICIYVYIYIYVYIDRYSVNWASGKKKGSPWTMTRCPDPARCSRGPPVPPWPATRSGAPRGQNGPRWKHPRRGGRCYRLRWKSWFMDGLWMVYVWYMYILSRVYECFIFFVGFLMICLDLCTILWAKKWILDGFGGWVWKDPRYSNHQYPWKSNWTYFWVRSYIRRIGHEKYMYFLVPLY
jgi:hypothetical protein